MNSVDEAVKILKNVLSKDILDELKADRQSSKFLHYEIALFIRNHFNLWDKTTNSYLTWNNADEFSHVILDELRNSLGVIIDKELSEHYKSKKLYLDDLRDVPEDFECFVRSYKHGVEFVKRYGIPHFISFDHDLGEDENGNLLPTGYDFAKWLVETDMDNMYGGFPENFSFNVHSANPVGKENIESYLNNYLKYKRDKNG